jgi:CheY-like chemotaxis protein
MPDQRPVILLAEDNAADVYLVQAALQTYDLTLPLHVVNDGQAAIEFIESAERGDEWPCPALALLDLNLPKRDGLEVLARLRGSAKCGRIPVTMISSSRPPSGLVDGPAPQADRFFTKPSNYEAFMQLGAVVRDLLQVPPR